MQSLRIAYAGTPEFAVPALQAIMASQHTLVMVLTQPDRKSGRGRKIIETPVKQTVTSEKVKVFQPENVNSHEVLDYIEKHHLDLLVVAAYGQIFSEALLNLPRLGCINIHASLLPRWRGASPIQQVLLAGEGETGITITQMHKEMDAGDIWLQVDCPVSPVDTAQTLHDKLAALGAETILPAIDLVSSGASKPTPQISSKASYCSKLKKSDGLIDWHETAEQIDRKVRALHPWPGAFTNLNGHRIRIVSTKICEHTHSDCLPGSIIGLTKFGISVATGSQNLEITELVPEGRKCMSAKDFSNSTDLQNQKFEAPVN